MSLSARRAWIEIAVIVFVLLANGVALRKESVDRNPAAVGSLSTHGGSLSARRAWIEIKASTTITTICIVALRKESVDRNLAVWAVEHAYQRRSPQGERG